MRRIKMTSFVLAAIITFTALEACEKHEQRPDGAIDISAAESELIESMQAEGKDELEIAEALVAYEDELNAASEIEESTCEAIADQTDASEETEIVFSDSSSADTTKPGDAPMTTNPSSAEATQKTSVTPKPSESAAAPKPTLTVTTKPTTTAATTTKPTATPKPTEQADNSYYDTDCEAECVRLINQLRKEEAVEEKCTFYVPVVNNLTSRAHLRCDELVDDFSHNSVSGNKMGSEAIYRGRGGNPSASSIVGAWKKSRGHYVQLLTGCIMGSGEYASKNCGLGVLRVGEVTYAVFGMSGDNIGESPSSGYVAPTSTPTPVPTNTPVPTSTPVTTSTSDPTSAPLPTDTPEPTNTPIPTNTPVPAQPTTPWIDENWPEIEL